MKFELLNAALYTWPYNDKNVDIVCTQLKGTVYGKRISIVPQLDEHSKRTERKVFVDINSLEELKELSDIFNKNIILNFGEEQPYIVIYDGYVE